MSKGKVTLTPLPEGHGLGPEYQRIQDEGYSDLVERIAHIVRQFDGANDMGLAQKIINMIHEGEPIED